MTDSSLLFDNPVQSSASEIEAMQSDIMQTLETGAQSKLANFVSGSTVVEKKGECD